MKNNKYQILIVFYSFTGETEKLVEYIKEGALKVPNTEVIIKRIPELIGPELFEKVPKLGKVKKELESKYPEATVQDLEESDGLIVGTPVHFGSMAGQVKQFFDQLSPIWMKNELVNKPVSVFCTGGSMHGGEETTLLSLIVPLMWLGMIPIGIPYPIKGVDDGFDGGSPLGALFTSGKKGQNEINEDDKKCARVLGERLATITEALCVQCVIGKPNSKQS